jgi:hypothetical protein
MKILIGKKVRAFKFESRERLSFVDSMNKYIGEVGVIKRYNDYNNSYGVIFDCLDWEYPADQIEAHIVDEWVVGEEYEFSDDVDVDTWYKRKLIVVLPEKYEAARRFIVQQGLDENNWTFYRHIRPIEKEDPIQKQIEKLEKELAELKQLTSNK